MEKLTVGDIAYIFMVLFADQEGNTLDKEKNKRVINKISDILDVVDIGHKGE